MRRRLALLSFLSLILVSTALYAKKKPKTGAVPAIPQMTDDQKILHALNRLTFGARVSDLDEVRQMGLERWIDLQLHPESIPENPVLEAKLAPLDTLRMSPRELVQHYPTPQIIKAIADGRQPFPPDPEERMLIQKLVANYQRKQSEDANAKPADDADPKVTIASLRIDPQQKETLKSGTPQDKMDLIESMPPDEQWEVLDAIPNGARQRLASAAPAISGAGSRFSTLLCRL